MTRGEAAWKSVAEARAAQLEDAHNDLAGLRQDMSDVQAENKAQAVTIAGLQQQITELKGRPDYAGIQGHLDAIEARNISRDEGMLAQLVAMTAAIVKLADAGPRTVRTRTTDAVKS